MKQKNDGPWKGGTILPGHSSQNHYLAIIRRKAAAPAAAVASVSTLYEKMWKNNTRKGKEHKKVSLVSAEKMGVRVD